MKKINFKLYFQKRKQRVSVSGISPRFDWLIIVCVALVFVCGGIVSATYLYIQVNNGSLFKVDEDTSVQEQLNVKKNKIEKTVESIKSKTTQPQIFDESVVN